MYYSFDKQIYDSLWLFRTPWIYQPSSFCVFSSLFPKKPPFHFPFSHQIAWVLLLPFTLLPPYSVFTSLPFPEDLTFFHFPAILLSIASQPPSCKWPHLTFLISIVTTGFVFICEDFHLKAPTR